MIAAHHWWTMDICIGELRTAAKTLHGESYVHGDIREPKVLITTSGSKVIDFNWCGEEGAARYPADIPRSREHQVA